MLSGYSPYSNAYLLMMLIVLFFALIMDGRRRKNMGFIIVAVIMMFALMGLRDCERIGNDSRTSYLWEYAEVRDGTYDIPKFYELTENPGLPHFMKAEIAIFGADYQLFLAIEAAIILIGFAHLISRYSVSPVQSVCYYWGLLYYLFMFSATKQALAMTILIFAFDAVIDKKPVRFLLLVLFAAWFHFPAFIFLAAYPMAQIKVGRSYIIFLAAAMVITFIFRNSIINLMMGAYHSEESMIDMGGLVFLGTKVIIMLVIITSALILRPMSSKDYTYSTLMKFMGIAAVLQTFCYYDNIFERLADYYYQFAVIFIPMVFDRSQNIRSGLDSSTAYLVKTVAPYMFGAYGVYRMTNYVAADWHFVPFRFFFQS